MTDTKYKTHISCRIYEVERGLLVRPRDEWDRENLFDDCDSMEEAQKEILEKGIGDYVVLPIVEKRIDWGNE